MITLALVLFAVHFLFDFPLQGDFLARGKNSQNPIPGVPWFWCMLAHAFLHGAGVAFITDSLFLGVCEFVAHFLIDHLKCLGVFSDDPGRAFSIDQIAHLTSKLLWVLMWFYV